ncbi:hypothetical protein OH809_24950 [Streptomyces sp. NBC_00873]|uniref:hypothetical protein n=1 Tax=Streptomyces sp. NBC_00873 TaxID=2975852 RepID=UPI003869977B|nr:hypothetical protein OH809_24950 [Streptomyces sp. NBC_00873]
MSYLPTLRREHPDRMVLDASAQAATVLIGLVNAWFANPEAIDALLVEVARLDECVREGIQLGVLGSAEHARDQLVDRLVTEAGGAEFHLSPKRDRYAAHQARRIAKEARRMAAALDGHANAIDVEVEAAERERSARQEAELMRLRAQLANPGHQPALPPALALQHPADR